MSQSDDEMNRENPGERTDCEENAPSVRSDRTSVEGGRHQFSIAALLVLQMIAAVLAFVTKAGGPGLAIVGVLVLLIVAIPIAGTVWVANNFQQAHQFGKKFGLASMVVYVIGAIASYIVVWLVG